MAPPFYNTIHTGSDQLFPWTTHHIIGRQPAYQRESQSGNYETKEFYYIVEVITILLYLICRYDLLQWCNERGLGVTDVVAWQPNEMRKEQRESMNLIDW